MMYVVGPESWTVAVACDSRLSVMDRSLPQSAQTQLIELGFQKKHSHEK